MYCILLLTVLSWSVSKEKKNQHQELNPVGKPARTLIFQDKKLKLSETEFPASMMVGHAKRTQGSKADDEAEFSE